METKITDSPVRQNQQLPEPTSDASPSTSRVSPSHRSSDSAFKSSPVKQGVALPDVLGPLVRTSTGSSSALASPSRKALEKPNEQSVSPPRNRTPMVSPSRLSKDSSRMDVDELDEAPVEPDRSPSNPRNSPIRRFFVDSEESKREENSIGKANASPSDHGNVAESSTSSDPTALAVMSGTPANSPQDHRSPVRSVHSSSPTRSMVVDSDLAASSKSLSSKRPPTTISPTDDEPSEPKRRKVGEEEFVIEDNKDSSVDGSEFRIAKVDGFSRPLNIAALKLKTEEFGDVEQFWMDKIRSYALIIYRDRTGANDCVGYFNGLRSAEYNNKKLSAFVTCAQELVAQGIETPQTIRQMANVFEERSLANQVSASSNSAANGENGGDQILSIDSIYFKTQVKPHIYFKPLHWPNPEKHK
eukprot:TRINITY_DN7879_c0_g1_i2.p1 TRINITY_DN7879_c0_g1~~TRINITY_DN7879_c0_g1_i2.p1  ORF type:complete len:415 (+),score=84.68 TRINITY_DN7879_c0_g1_i2:219-1463(+)